MVLGNCLCQRRFRFVLICLQEHELSPVAQVPWACNLPRLSSETATDALNCCIAFCSSTKLWVTPCPASQALLSHALLLSQTRIMATSAVAILSFRCKQPANYIGCYAPRIALILIAGIKWFCRRKASLLRSTPSTQCKSPASSTLPPGPSSIHSLSQAQRLRV